MISRILITFCILIFSVVVPILEINASHVFNPNWPAHARFHEVWQLITNCGIGLLCLWLVWLKGKIQMASVLVAHAMQGLYGSSLLSGNISKTIFGMELGAFTAIVAVAMAIGAALLESHKDTEQSG
jgi:hypothetical protein